MPNMRGRLLALAACRFTSPQGRGTGACRYDSPLQPVTARLIHVGDSAGNRSALSFAGAGRAQTWPYFFSSFTSLALITSLQLSAAQSWYLERTVAAFFCLDAPA